MNKHAIYASDSPEWIEAYKRFIRRSIEILAESDYLQSEEIINAQIKKMVEFEFSLSNVSFDVPLNIDLQLFNITTWEPQVSDQLAV